ncbi:MAG: translation initiation factor IF-3 [Deltaproteobacteria bacterium]|nr:MAG: translation initiation factor IF-3 [Deltaproteobacteria bacterium]
MAAEKVRVNRQIRVPQVRLIGDAAEQIGVIDTDEALTYAEERGLDLVEVSPQAKPPVCKVMDYGKFKYQQSKRAQEAKKKQTVIQVKEIKMRPRTDVHDLDVKIRSIVRFLESGDKVKVTIRFRGREMAYTDQGHDLLVKVAERVKEYGVVEQHAKREGRQLMMVLGPVKKIK